MSDTPPNSQTKTTKTSNILEKSSQKTSEKITKTSETLTLESDIS
jgi:hypothetical protein